MLLLTVSVVISGRSYQFPGEVMMLTIIIFLYSFILSINPTSASATGLQFRLGSCFQSGMVLQSSDKPGGAKLWGWGQPGAEVEVELSNGTQLDHGRVGGEGWWSLGLRLAPGGPYNLTLHHRYHLTPHTSLLANLVSVEAQQFCPSVSSWRMCWLEMFGCVLALITWLCPCPASLTARQRSPPPSTSLRSGSPS